MKRHRQTSSSQPTEGEIAAPLGGIEELPDVGVAGTLFIVAVNKQFNVDIDALVRDVPPDVRELAADWAFVFLAWTYRRHIGDQFGWYFRDAAIEAAWRFLSASETSDTEETLGFWFERFDAVFEMLLARGAAQGAALVFLADDPRSPWYGADELDKAQYEVSQRVGEALQGVLLAAAPMMSQLTIECGEGLDWNYTPGCFEQHLQRRFASRLFQADRRVVTTDELAKAQAIDEAELENLTKDYGVLLSEIEGLPEEMPAQDVSRLREWTEELMERAASQGPKAMSTLESLEELRSAIIASYEDTLADLPDVLSTLRDANEFFDEGWELRSNHFVAQQGRSDSPISPEEIFPSLFAEDVETVAATSRLLGAGGGATSVDLYEAACGIAAACDAATRAAYKVDAKLELMAVLHKHGPRKCTDCGLINEPGQETCDCGASLVGSKEPDADPAGPQAPAASNENDKPEETIESKRTATYVAIGTVLCLGQIGSPTWFPGSVAEFLGSLVGVFFTPVFFASLYLLDKRRKKYAHLTQATIRWTAARIYFWFALLLLVAEVSLRQSLR